MAKVNITSTVAPSKTIRLSDSTSNTGIANSFSVTKPTVTVNKGTQADHHVTDNANHTKPVSQSVQITSQPTQVQNTSVRIPTQTSTPSLTEKDQTKTIDTAENKLKNQAAAGKIKDIGVSKTAIAKKTGVWPNGATN